MARIGVDVRKWSDYGIGRYIRELLAALLEIDTRNEYVLFARPAEVARIPRPRPGVTVEAEPAGLYTARELWSLPGQAARHRLDLLHVPHYTLPPALPCPAVVTIHDLVHLTLPASRWRLLYARAMIAHALRAAARVIVPSEAVRVEVAARFPSRAAKVCVVAHGLSPLFARADAAAPEESAEPEGGWPADFLLFVGNERPYKNLRGVLAAFGGLGSDYGGALLLAGLPRPPSAWVLDLAGRLGVRDRLHWTGPLEDSRMPHLYRRARVLLAPSLAEGFGFPVLEAMASGLPVVTSRGGAQEEIAGEAALLVDPRRSEEIAGAVRRLLGDPELAGRLARHGRERALGYRWSEAARRTLAVYQEALAGKREGRA